MIVCQLALRWKFHAAPTGAVIEPGPGCRELPLSDLYHNVAVTAIQIAFNLLIKRILLSCANSSQCCCRSGESQATPTYVSY